MNRLISGFIISSFMFGLVTFTGCDNSQPTPPANTADKDDHDHDHGHDHDGHDHGHGDEGDKPDNLQDWVLYVGMLDLMVEDAFAKKDMEKAHDPVHDVGMSLKDLEAQIKKEKLSEEDAKAAEQAINSLYDAFGEIDKNWHGDKKGAQYSEKQKDIKAALATLAKLAGVELPKELPKEEQAEPESKTEQAPEKADAAESPEAKTPAKQE